SCERVAGVDVNRVWAIPRPGTFSATFLPSLARFLLLHGKRYDVWHVHQAFYHAGLARTIAGVVGRPCVVKDAASGVFGDVAGLRRVWQGGWVPRQLRLADAVISLNSEMTTELRDVGIPQERIRLIPNGVDCGHFISPSAHQRARAREELGIASTDVVTLCA